MTNFGLRKATFIERATMASHGIDPIEMDGEHYFTEEEYAYAQGEDALVVAGNTEYFEY